MDQINNWIKKSLKGEQQAQRALYDAYKVSMYNTCLRFLKNATDSEDALQDAFVYAFRKLAAYRGDSTFGAWLKRIVINTCINQLKKKHLDLAPWEDVPEPVSEVIDERSIEWEIESIKRAMKHLAEGYRLVFTLYAFEGYDHVEISEIMNISESASKSQFHRAKKKIVELIKLDKV